MPASIVTKSMRVANANNLRQSIGRTTPTPEKLYMFEGRPTPWTTDANPPTPIDYVADELVTRNGIIGIKLVSFADTCQVVPRINWVSGTTYAAYSTTDDALFSKNFYVLTDDYYVYKCIAAGAGASTIKPTGTSTSQFNTADGYTWKFMYDITPSFAVNFLTNEYMPVPSGSAVSSLQTTVQNAASYSGGSPIGGHGASAVDELGASYVMVSKLFSYSENGVLPVNVAFRQVGLLLNPKAAVGGAALSGDVYAASSVDLLSGRILTVDNRTPNYRDAAQQERLQIVFSL